jgi:RNA polymerase sigma-70 factor (ECF subfamily)
VATFLDTDVASVYRFALRLTGDRHAAEDLAQETLLRAWRRRERLRDPRVARVWLLKITTNLWRDHLRRGKLPAAQVRPLADDPPAPAASAHELTTRQDDLRQALGALDGLPSRQREVLYLNACEGLTLAEIAEVLGITVESAKASLSLARKKLRELLPDVDPAPDCRR